jgi:forkhead box protein J2/3
VESQPQTQEYAPEAQAPANQTYDDPNAHAQFVAPPAMHPDEAGPSRQQVPYPPPYPPFVWSYFSKVKLSNEIFSFNPNFPMMAPDPRFPPPIPGVLPISPDEGFELDEHGNVNWRLAWLKELGHLQQITAEQEKAGVDPEWYRMMLFRVRSALMPPPPMNPEVMHGMPPPPHMQPPPPQDMAQQTQTQQQPAQ